MFEFFQLSCLRTQKISIANLLFAVDIVVLAMLTVLGVGDDLRCARSGVTNDRELMGVSERDGVERVEGSRVKLRSEKDCLKSHIYRLDIYVFDVYRFNRENMPLFCSH